jgi:Zn-dependent protease with chaperone function
LLFFNWIVRRWPRRYWLGAWVVTLPLIVLSAFAEPLFEPIFNHYEPLAKNHPALVVELEKVVSRTGTNIPPDRIFLMKASAKSNGLNAYVSGLGVTKRIVVWDTMADRIPSDEVLFLCGHETGHYVLHHIPKMLAGMAVALFFVYWACAGFAAWLVRRFAVRWALNKGENQMDAGAPSIAFSAMGGSEDINGREASIGLLSTRAGFIVLLFTVAGFVLAPFDNTISRHFEHEADVYGQEAIHGIVADPRKTAIAAFNALGEAWLDDPTPSPFIEFWTYNHPSTQTRANFAAHYDPWANGGHGQFFEK